MTYLFIYQLQALIDWLNPKGLREYRLKRELEKQYQNIVNGMKKRVSVSIFGDV